MGAVTVSAGRIERTCRISGRRDRGLPDRVQMVKSAPVLGDYAVTTPFENPQAGAPFVMQDTGWDHALKVTGDGEGLVGHSRAVLLRKLADQAGLTAAPGSALARAGKYPLVDRGIALVSMAVAIVLGATSMNDITLLAHHAAVLGPEPSDTTVRRTLELADLRTLDKVARVQAAVRAHVWSLIAATPAGFPWLAVAGKLLAGWLVIDLDATLITARSDKEGAAPNVARWEQSSRYGPRRQCAASRCGPVHTAGCLPRASRDASEAPRLLPRRHLPRVRRIEESHRGHQHPKGLQRAHRRRDSAHLTHLPRQITSPGGLRPSSRQAG